MKNDIIEKSILFFDRKYKTKTKLKFLVYKKIPVGYGLGGGSSNAASILKFLYKYHQITSKNFEKDAPLIGSDVIIFKDKYPKIIDGLNQYKYLKAKKYYWRKVYLIFPSQNNINVYHIQGKAKVENCRFLFLPFRPKNCEEGELQAEIAKKPLS